MARYLTAALCVLALGCSKKEGPKPTSDSDSPKPSATDGAAPPVDPDREPEPAPAAPAVPALGAVDSAAVAASTKSYKAVRGLFKLTADDDATPSKTQRAALEDIAGKTGAKRAAEIATDAGWGPAMVNAWLTRMAADAGKNLKAVVRLPLSACVGWGSATPSTYVAAGCMSAAVFFVKPAGETKLVDACDKCWSLADDKVDDCRDKRCQLVVEGYFTGKEHPTVGGPPGEPGPVAHEFHVQRARVAQKLSPPTLRLPGGHGPAPGSAVDDGLEWGVMWASAFAIDDGHAEAARKQADKLEAAGFTGVEVVDSRQIRTLWCCSQAVVIGRFEGKKEAKARAAEVTKKGFTGIIVREMY